MRFESTKYKTKDFNTHDLGSPPVDTSEAVQVACTRLLLFLKLGGIDHHGNVSLAVLVGEVLWVGETTYGFLSLVVSAFADEPPR